MSNRKIEMFEIRQVIMQLRAGVSVRKVSQLRGIGRNKVKQIRDVALSQNWLEPSKPLPTDEVLLKFFKPGKKRAMQESSVIPYKALVTKWYEQGIQASTIHATLVRDYNFEHGYASVQRFIKKLKAQTPAITTILDFSPGDAAQVDFGKGPTITDQETGEIFDTWFFVMTLAFSRHQYAEVIRHQDVKTWLGCHKRAFEFFGGVPVKVIIDNPKCAITKACYHNPTVQRAYAECAEGYGFLISPCPVRDPKKKGIVESGVKYVKKNFMPLREFTSLADANTQLREWVLDVAGKRIHGTTREKPLARFTDIESATLKALPDVPPELASWHKVKVHGDCHIQFNKCRYSAPYKLVNQMLWLRASETTTRLYQEHELVAIHPRLNYPGQRHTIDEHLPPNALAYKMRDPQWCLHNAENIGPHCLVLIKRLFDDKVVDNLRAAQGIIRLKDSFGKVRLNKACYRALVFNTPFYKTIKAILTKGLDNQPLPKTTELGVLADIYTGNGRFTRRAHGLIH